MSKPNKETIKKSLDKFKGADHSKSSINKPITLIKNPPKPPVTPKKK